MYDDRPLDSQKNFERLAEVKYFFYHFLPFNMFGFLKEGRDDIKLK